MIKLDDNEKRRLAINYEHIPDRDLIRELVRRGRLREYEASAVYYKELEGDDRYMGMIRHNALHTVAHQIDDDKEHLPALVTVRPDVTDFRGTRSVMTTDLVALVARSKKEG